MVFFVTKVSIFCINFLQIDLHAEEMENNVPAEVALLGDLRSVTEQVSLCINITQVSSIIFILLFDTLEFCYSTK